MDEYDHRQIEELPTCTRRCAILTRRSERDEALKDLRAEEWPEQRPPMREEGETWDEAFSEDGKLIVASDGACPNQQGDSRARRSGQGLFYGEGHACNSSWPTDTYSQGAQRAEVRAAARWVAWAWGPTELWTDSALVVRGMRNILSGFTHGMKGHKDLWRRIELGINAKGKENFAVKKVKGHMKEKECKGNEQLLEEKRRNDKADELADEGSTGKQAHLHQDYAGQGWKPRNDLPSLRSHPRSAGPVDTGASAPSSGL